VRGGWSGSVGLVPEWSEILSENAAAYARVAIDNIGREYPSGIYHTMTRPGDFPNRPAARSPVFYGSYDWHSCVEMHWLLVRLLRTAPGSVPADEVRAVLSRQFQPAAIEIEAAFISGPDGRAERPYGWGWALTLVHEVDALAGTGDVEASRWSQALAPLGDVLTDCLVGWLPKATYPVRSGLHQNSAFGLSRSLPHALARSQAGDARLAEAIGTAADRWFGADRAYPAAWEPSGSDFLSAALTEAELMAQLLPGERFAAWLTGFLPGIVDGEPAAIFTPATVSDSSDGQTAHLHGLNASRAWCWRRIAGRLAADDPRVEPANQAAREHAEAALPHVIGDHYNVEHWLAAYAVLLLT
jgi:hypothetical protein